MTTIKNILETIDNPNLTPISGTDATFLYTDSPNSPMHVAFFTIVEGSLSFDDFKTIISSRIHKLPKFRQRLVNVPFNLDYPYWADDPNFDLELHLQRIALPSPNDWKTLRELTSSNFSQPLDMRRPLWSITFIEGLDAVSQVPPGSVAIITKIHHVMIDGVSGMGMMGILYDKTPDISSPESQPPAAYQPKQIPNDLSVMLKSYVGFVKNPLKLPKAVGGAVINNVKNKLSNKIKPANEIVESKLIAPRTIFNNKVSPRRKWGAAILSLDRVKTLKNKMDVSLNDIVLAICAGAIRRYLLEKQKLPTSPLIANIPISTRKEDDDGKMNNQISNMTVSLATHIEDPITRLEIIHEHTIRGKEKHKAIGASNLAKMADAVPFGLANLAAGIYTHYNLSKVINPPFNVTITNVPGPRTPLYLNGHKVFTILGTGPVIDGLGLMIPVLSYNGTLTISPTSDANTMPDMEVFCRYLRDSANELERVILQKEKKEANKQPKSELFFKSLRKFLTSQPESSKSLNGLYQFHVTGEVPTDWQINLNRTPAIIKKGIYKKPDAIITVDDRNINRIAKGEIGLQEAMIQGRIAIKDPNNKIQNVIDLISKFEKSILQ